MYVSLKDVAAASGVSFQTVSKVLNGGRVTVTEATRARVLQAAVDLGYVPNALARGLARRSSLTVGVLVDDFVDAALSQFVAAAQWALSAQGHAVLVASTSPDEDPARAVNKLREHRVGGILVIAPSLESDPRLGDGLRRSPPSVSLNHVPGGRVAVIGSDHSQTGAAAAAHLLELGHDVVATITGPRTRRVVASRHRGFRRTLLAAGRRLPAQLVAEADWTPAGAYAAAYRLLDREPDLSAVYVHSDVMAIGVLRALSDRGRRVPADCSVVGCDDLPLAAYLIPPLTTVHVPFAETGEQAVGLLLRRIRGDPIPRRTLLPTQLVVRDSTSLRKGAS